MSDTYSVVITGNVIPGFDLESVQNSLSQLFKINHEKVKLYLSGKPNVLKKDTDHQTASKYKSKIEKLGASVELRKSLAAAKDVQTAKNPNTVAVRTAKSQKPAPGKAAPRKAICRQTVIDKMFQPATGSNIIEQGRLKQKYKMEKIQIAKEPVSLWLMLLSLICMTFGIADFTLSYLDIFTITNSFWSPIAAVVIGSVLLKSSFES